MIHWWLGFDPRIRRAIALTLLLASTIALVAGESWEWGIGFGVVLLLFSGPDEAEKGGYRW